MIAEPLVDYTASKQLVLTLYYEPGKRLAEAVLDVEAASAEHPSQCIEGRCIIRQRTSVNRRVERLHFAKPLRCILAADRAGAGASKRTGSMRFGLGRNHRPLGSSG